MDIIKIEASDGKVFVTNKTTVKCFGVINTLLRDCEKVLDENSSAGIVPLQKVDSVILPKILAWAEHQSAKNEDTEDAFMSQWEKTFFDVDLLIVFEIISAADYLDNDGLFRAGCRAVANMIKNKTVAQIRTIFNIGNDLQPGD